MKQIIEVTEDDIQNAIQGVGTSCMVWKAVTRQLQLETEATKNPVVVNVDYDSIVFSGQKGQLTVQNSARTNQLIRSWDYSDGKETTKPFKFHLDLPEDWREQVMGLASE